ncbi:hypothetical protein ACFYMW_30280 [Streptomyces sp. NPDC006692]
MQKSSADEKVLLADPGQAARITAAYAARLRELGPSNGVGERGPSC